jgi:RNA polymerase sigma-70 factor (ECF subfamily)
MASLPQEKEKFLLFRYLRFGDRTAFGELFDAYQKQILRFLCFKLPTEEDAADVMSQTFMQLMEYAKTTRIENFSALLYKIARNNAATFYQRHERERGNVSFNEKILSEVEKTHYVLPDVEGVEEESPFALFSKEQVRRFIRRLEQDDRDVVVMRFEEEMSVRQIAEIIGKTENATRVMIHRALQRIRNMIYDERSPIRKDDQTSAPK